MTRKQKLVLAAHHADWVQVVGNGGPPCFHLEPDGHFCLRAERWDGHKPFGKYKAIHAFVSLEALIKKEAS